MSGVSLNLQGIKGLLNSLSGIEGSGLSALHTGPLGADLEGQRTALPKPRPKRQPAGSKQDGEFDHALARRPALPAAPTEYDHVFDALDLHDLDVRRGRGGVDRGALDLIPAREARGELEAKFMQDVQEADMGYFYKAIQMHARARRKVSPAPHQHQGGRQATAERNPHVELHPVGERLATSPQPQHVAFLPSRAHGARVAPEGPGGGAGRGEGPSAAAPTAARKQAELEAMLSRTAPAALASLAAAEAEHAASLPPPGRKGGGGRGGQIAGAGGGGGKGSSLAAQGARAAALSHAFRASVQGTMAAAQRALPVAYLASQAKLGTAWKQSAAEVRVRKRHTGHTPGTTSPGSIF